MNVVSPFSFAGILLSVDIRSLFDFDRMHVLSLPMRKLLREFHVSILGDSNKTTSVLTTRSGICGTFKSIKRSAHHFLNRFLKKVFCASPELGPSLGSSYGNGISQCSEPFCNHGLTRLLEAESMDNAEKLSPILGGIVDAFCKIEDVNVTSTNALYVDMVKYL